MEKDEGLQTMVSAAGAERSSFFLRTDGNRWIFTVVQEDDDDRHVNLIGTSIPAEGVWTHVAGVYDAGAKEIRLYVNGVLEATTSVDHVFEATGPLELGVDRWNGVSPGHKPWRGQLSDVQVWDRVVFGAELKPLTSTLVL